MSERYVLAGLARAGAGWFGLVGRWANEGTIPAEFVKCVSPEELRARLGSGRPWSAIIVDAALPAVDRDLLDAAHRAGAAAIVVADSRVERDWSALGADATVSPRFDRTELIGALTRVARPVRRADDVATTHDTDADAPVAAGRLIAVTGGGGVGTSVLAMALARSLADDARYASAVLLADLALDADQAVLHDARDVVPGLPELVELHRSGEATTAALDSIVFAPDQRGYHLLLGLRRHRDWTGLRRRALEAAIDSLVRTYRFVVADTDADLEGEGTTGGADIEDRNALARVSVDRADVVVALGRPDLTGLHTMVRTVSGLVDFGIGAERILPVFNHAPRRPRDRAELSATLAGLVGRPAETMATPVYVTHRRRLEALLYDGLGPPAGMGDDIARACGALIDRIADTGGARGSAAEPELVAPGSLGSFADEGTL